MRLNIIRKFVRIVQFHFEVEAFLVVISCLNVLNDVLGCQLSHAHGHRVRQWIARRQLALRRLRRKGALRVAMHLGRAQLRFRTVVVLLQARVEVLHLHHPRTVMSTRLLLVSLLTGDAHGNSIGSESIVLRHVQTRLQHGVTL